MSYDRLSPESPIDTNIDRLAQAFPSVVREGKVDFDALRQLLGDDIGEPHELYGLNWKGKAQARRAALTPSLGTLRPCPEESVDWDSTKNLYIEGDNLEVLKLLRKSYSGKVKMIYIDPPYNTGKEFVYLDDYQGGIDNYKTLTDQEDAFLVNLESNGRFHTDWLNMMYPRLSIARELLADDGVIFISIDDNEVANLSQICDEIFGQGNFIARLIWERAFSPKNDSRYVSNSHDYVIFFSKNISKFQIGRLPRTEDANSRYANPDNDPRGVWMSSDLLVKTYSKDCDYPITTPSGRVIEPPPGRCWRLSQKAFEERRNENRIWFGPNGEGTPRIKRFLSELKFNGMAPTSIMSFKDVGHSQEASQEVSAILEGAFFNGPKPLRLLKRLLILSNLKDDSLVLDFFSGSATTAHAVMQMNAEDGGKRRHIMVQLPEPCKANTPAGQAGYKNICEIGKERIRRAGKKLKEEAGLIGQGLDTGFRVYKLDSSNVKPWAPDAEDLGASMDLFSEHLVEGRTSDDLLTEVMLKSGIDLCEETETREIAGHRVYSLGYGQFYACMDRDLSGAEGELALGIAAWHAEECAAVGGEQQDTCTVFVADEAFAGRDDAKMNFVSTLQQYGICNVKAL